MWDSPGRCRDDVPGSGTWLCKGESIGNTSFLPPLQSITGHEFHYSRVLPDRDAQFAFRLTRGKGIDSGKDGLTSGNALGTFTHAYFTDAFAKILLMLHIVFQTNKKQFSLKDIHDQYPDYSHKA